MKTCIVVPVFNCTGVIEAVLDSLLQATDQDILVVDDGSEIPVQKPVATERLQVLRIEKNQGKGLALRRAFAECADRGYTHALSFDGDGQHKAADVAAMLASSRDNSEAIIIGVRRFDETVPGISQFGRKFSNFWVWYQTGLRVQDSQSGLRIYPLQPLKGLYFFTKRYDFEIEVLVRGIWQGLAVREVVVDVYYPPGEQRISHFHKIKDNFRITCLNIYLIAWSLIFHQKSFIKVLVTAILSVPISLIPGLTVAVLVAIMTCVVLRLNVILMLICLIVLRIF